MDEIGKLNPSITEIEIGIRKLRTIKLYPLSFRDQEKMTATVSDALQRLSSVASSGGADVAVILAAVKEISQNADTFLDLVMDKEEKGDDILAELTNEQLISISETIYRVNYENLQKKVRGLFGIENKASASQPERPSQLSFEDIRNIGLKTSSESPSETEV